MNNGRRMSKSCVMFALSLAILTNVASLVHAGPFTILATEPAPGPRSGGIRVSAISSDGSVVVGMNGNGPFRWTRQTGLSSLGPVPDRMALGQSR